MFDYDAAVKAGHDLTLVGQSAGNSTYSCENCGAVVVLYQGHLKIWHAPRGSFTTEPKCVRAGDAAGLADKRSLERKLKDLYKEQLDAMAEAAGR